MNREWRHGSIELVAGYRLFDANGDAVSTVADVEFAIEGGYVNVRIPGRADTQIVSAPGVRLIVCDSLGSDR
jgi:hypothetical protein